MSSALEKRWYAAIAAIGTCVLCGTHGVQVSHSNQERGIGQKSSPSLCAALCPKCHNDIDNGTELNREQRLYLHWRAIGLTHEALFASGKLDLARGNAAEVNLQLQKLEEERELLVDIGRQLISGAEFPAAVWDVWTEAQAADAAAGHPWKGWGEA